MGVVFQAMVDKRSKHFLQWWGNSGDAEKLYALNADSIGEIELYIVTELK